MTEEIKEQKLKNAATALNQGLIDWFQYFELIRKIVE